MGVIDFGDMVRSWQLNELAICAAYVLIYLSYDKWFEVAILALPAGGWEKKHTPDYQYSGYYSEGPVVPVACLRVNLLEGLAGLKKARKWAADGHPRDHPDSCW